MVAAAAQDVAAAAAVQDLAAAVVQDLAVAQGLGPAVVACMRVAEGQARPRGRGERGVTLVATPARRLRPADVWFAVFAGEHSMAQCVGGCGTLSVE